MLPSRGFFKKNDCPFFEKGLCLRPHCHFRHKKKATNESTSYEPSRILSKPTISIIDPPEDFKVDSATKPIRNETLNSAKVPEKKDETSSSDSLFAKLVNQGNSYEKITRHIPCAYTPTPQTKTVQPKSKPVKESNGCVNNAKSLEIINNARTLLQNYNTDHVKNKSEIDDINKETESDKYLCNKNVESYVPEGLTNNVSYLPNSKTESSDLGASANRYLEATENSSVNAYVPTKGKTIEDKYVPNSSTESHSSKQYVPSKEKKECKYVPKHTSKVENKAKYTPSDKKETGESRYQPGGSNFVNDYVPTEKSATNSNNGSWLTGDAKNDLDDFEFITSEIEMMKELLKDDVAEQTSEIDPEKTSAGSDEKTKKKRDESSSEHNSRRRSSKSKDEKSRSSSSKRSSSRRRSSSDRRRHDGKSCSDEKRQRKSKSHSSSRHSSKKKKRRSSHEESDKDRKKRKLEKERESDNGGDGNCDFGDDDPVLLDEDFEENPEEVEEECLKIFNDYYSNEEKERKTSTEITVSSGEYEDSAPVKKRTAHSSALTSDHSVLRDKTVKKVNKIKSAQEVLQERYKTVQKPKETANVVQLPMPAPVLGLSRPGIRIAAVSNIQQMLEAKKKIQDKINQGLRVNERTTIAQTVSRGSSRIAHAPTSVQETVEKPTIKDGSKQVPRIKRQTYLDKLLIETNQIYPSKSESAEEALKLEEEVFKAHSGSSSAYHAAFVSLLVKTRKRVASVRGQTSSVNIARPKMSHFDVLSGGKKNFSVIKTRKVDINMLTEKHIYEELLRCCLTPEEIVENGFPVESDRPGFAACKMNYELKYNDKYIYIKKMSGNMRYCVRCSKQYEVDPRTLKQHKEGPGTCCYHPGKKKSGGRNADRVYNCCNNSSSSEGCATHVRHVTDCNDYENLPNCVKTLSKDHDPNPAVYALDCEMVYTRLGYELARVTVVNLKKEVVYDTLVKPKYPIECYNTLYSGIEEKMMEGVDKTLQDVQAALLTLFSNKTILIGHSLDSDLRALHLIHDTIVDTSVVYKNEKYYPYKYSLKDLCAKKISKIIQDNVGGHDSTEDAIAALEIMLQHVKEEVSKYDSIESYEADRAR